MQYYKVEIIVDKEGNVIYKVVATGSGCTAITEELNQALGEVRSQEILPEYNQEMYVLETETVKANNSAW
jgi:hypothetical protein